MFRVVAGVKINQNCLNFNESIEFDNGQKGPEIAYTPKKSRFFGQTYSLTGDSLSSI